MQTCTMPEHGRPDAPSACCRPEHLVAVPEPVAATGFWGSRSTWRRAARNTLTCLVGCSIGDFGMLFYLQVYHPDTPMMVTMVAAMSAGILTSIALETAMLRYRERFAWGAALRTAVSMSFISMLGMELAATTTDMAMTGGVVDPATAWFWFSLVVSLGVGFLAPLPYNYYQLAKHGRACH